VITEGTRLGPYEILGQIGAGGMGEVYRAKDSRLAREVAIKVLPASLSNDADRLRRFEQEAKAAGLLNHPNITAVYDIGSHDGAPYVVSELLEGETLRAALAGGKLSLRRAIDYALQMAHGLAAAHEKGIVHRDLKPENLFVTKDGRLKILDFGLAKLTHAEESKGQQTALPTATAGTEPGVVMGTLGYMAPEQVRGRPADVRSDIFSFGAILYEMLSGRRAFQGDSAADTMSAILREDPPELSVTNQSLPPGLERIVRHCLEKNPEQRFHSAHDLAFDLESLSAVSTPGAPSRVAATAAPKRKLSVAIVAGVVLVAAVLGALAAGRLAGRRPLTFQKLTFQRGAIVSARFAPDGQTIVYGAAWNGKPFEAFSARLDSTLSRSLGLPPADLLAVSASGEMALSLNRRFTAPYIPTGTLAQAPLAGGSPRPVLENVTWADWSQGDGGLAIVRDTGSENRLEFPIGKTLYVAAGGISHARISPQGDLIAFHNHRARAGDFGDVSVVDRQGRKTDLSTGWESLWGLAWSPRGDEVWFTGARSGGSRSLYAVNRSGRLRLLHNGTGELALQDAYRDGRVLLLDDPHRLEMVGFSGRETTAHDLTFLDYSAARDLSPDGKLLLFDESGDGGGPKGSVYLRGTDGSAPTRLGDGSAIALSPDGRWVLGAHVGPDRRHLVLYPTGVGQARILPALPGEPQWPDWLPNGKGILVPIAEAGHGVRLYIQDVETGQSRAVSGEGVALLLYSHLVAPDGRSVAARGPDGRTHLYPLDGGPPGEIPGLEAGEDPLRWSADGRALFLYRPGELPARVFRMDLASGRRELWRTLLPPDPAGVVSIRPPLLTPDGSVCVYSYSRFLSTLYLVEGLK
jgi:eukaryotic-like serine/threonine-protein kinase